MKNQKGFAVSSIMYAILILFLILVTSILASLANRKLLLDKTKNDVMNRLNGRVMTSNLTFDWSTIVLSTAIDDVAEINFKQGIHAVDPEGNEIALDLITYTLDPTFNIKVAGNYQVTYAVPDPNEGTISMSAPVVVKEKEEMNFDYTGAPQEYYAIPGLYHIQAWGAQGGSMNAYSGGKGAYTSGDLIVKQDQTLYIYVGGAGTTLDAGGYNGGGTLTAGQSAYGRSGGGATDIRLVGGSWDNETGLNSRLMVAAGGGGANYRAIGYGEGNGGFGGTLAGGDGESTNHTNGYGYGIGYGATQTTGGNFIWYPGSTVNAGNYATGFFGLGGGAITADYFAQSGGGGGYYGGGSSGHGGAGGGSSYISGHSGCIAIKSATDRTPVTSIYTEISNSYHYSGNIFTNTTMVMGNESMPNHDNTSNMTGNVGNGYVKIIPLVLYSENS